MSDDNLPTLEIAPDLPIEPAAAPATQFSLRAMFFATTGFAMLFAVCAGFKLPPLQLLAAFAISAVTAVVTIGGLQLAGRIGTRWSRSQIWGRCRNCHRRRYVYANDRCHDCSRVLHRPVEES